MWVGVWPCPPVGVHHVQGVSSGTTEVVLESGAAAEKVFPTFPTPYIYEEPKSFHDKVGNYSLFSASSSALNQASKTFVCKINYAT